MLPYSLVYGLMRPFLAAAASSCCCSDLFGGTKGAWTRGTSVNCTDRPTECKGENQYAPDCPEGFWAGMVVNLTEAHSEGPHLNERLISPSEIKLAFRNPQSRCGT